MKTNTYQEITVREAAFISGFSENWLRILISKEKAFFACKPYGAKNGWRIYRPSFEDWLHKRRYETQNTLVGRRK